jgi:hypothetical protein
VFGAFGFLCSCWQFAPRLELIFIPNWFVALLPEILAAVFTFVSALAGFGILRRWEWARIAIEILASILFTCSIILFLSLDYIPAYGAMAAFAFYSLIIALFVRYEPRDTAPQPAGTDPSVSTNK